MRKVIIRVPNKNYNGKTGVLEFKQGEAIIEGENFEQGIATAKSFGYEIEVVEDKPKAEPKQEPKTAPKKTTRKAAPKPSEDK